MESVTLRGFYATIMTGYRLVEHIQLRPQGLLGGGARADKEDLGDEVD